MKLAYGAIGWSGSLRDVAERVQKIGYEGIEGFGLLDLDQSDREIVDFRGETGVEFIGTYFSRAFVDEADAEIELRDFDETCNQMKKWGASIITVGGGQLRDGHRTTDWEQFTQQIKSLEEIATRFGIKLCFHPHFGTLVFTADEIARFLSQTSRRVHLTLDSAHLEAASCDVVDCFKRFWSRVAHVHLKDYDGEHFTELGKGKTQLKQLLKWLIESGYDGWVTVELDAADDPEMSAKINWDYLKANRATIRLRE
jgi:inosose dehydratase